MKTRGKYLASIAAVIFVLSLITAAFAVPQTINYQGYIEDSGGTPVNSSLSMMFSIYNAPAGGSALWTETQSTVTVTDGAFSVALGSVTPISLPFDEQYYLGVKVESDSEMTPRAMLVSVPYAMRAGAADTAATALTLEDKNLSQLVSLLDKRYGVGDALVADFSAAPTAIYTNQSVNFTNLSQGVPISWTWDFGDTGTSTLENPPPYTYAAPGAYTVTLTVNDGITSNIKSVTDYITVNEIAPDFTVDKTVVALNETVNFTDLTQGVPISWNWDFGDTGTSTLQNPSYQYSTGGTYTVSLTVDDGATQNTETKTDYITYYPFSRGTITALDTNGTVGYHTSIANGADNLPVMAYYDVTNWNLKVLHCGNTDCSSGNTITTVDSTGNVGQYTSIAIGADNLPVISYWDVTNHDLKVAHCGNVDCSSVDAITTLDAVGLVGGFSSIAIGSDDLPVISYSDSTNGDLKVAHCRIANCSSADSIVAVDVNGNVGRWSSIAIGGDGLPVIAYENTDSYYLKVAHCSSENCTSVDAITTIDSTGNFGGYTSIAIGSDNLPVISYFDGPNGDLKVAHCGDVQCSTGNTIETVDSTGSVGMYTSIDIGSDNLPVISYYDNTNQDLKVAHCGDAACSWSNTLNTVDATGNLGQYSSITIGADNMPVIAFYFNSDLGVAHCEDVACTLWP